MKPFLTISRPSLKNYSFFVTFVIVVGLCDTVNAQKLTINTGGSLVLNGTVSLVINNAAFQNNGTFAAGASTVVFAGSTDTTTAYVGGNTTSTFNNLSVIKSAYGVALKSKAIVANVLTVNGGNLYADSNLTLRSDVNLTARVAPVAATSQIIGKATVERYIPGKRAWRLMTAPVTSSNTIYNTWQDRGADNPGIGLLVTGPNPTGASGNGLDVSAQNSVSMKTWNYSTQALVNVLNTKVPISAGNTGSADNTGYFIFIRGDRNPANTCTCTFTNTTVSSIGALQTGTQTFPASSVSGKYTLIGNPYASPVNFANLSLNNLVNRFYVWDPALNLTGGYVMMDDPLFTGTWSQSVPSAQTTDIQSGQAFFVETKNNNQASVTFNESSKSSNRSNVGFRPYGVPSGILKVKLNLLNADNTTTLADGTFAEFNNIFSSGIDRDDAVKFGNTNENLSIVRNTISLAAERRPALHSNDTIYLKLTTTTQRAYQFVFDAANLQHPDMIGYLVDNYLGTVKTISLDGSTTVNFSVGTAAASAAPTRFKIVFKPAVVLPVTVTTVKAYHQNGDIAVEWTVENEINIVKYDVEKSTDGRVFRSVNTTMATADRNAANVYKWIDTKVTEGNNFYRIKWYDLNDTVKYSQLVHLVMERKMIPFTIYPNPVKGNNIHLEFANQPAGNYKFSLISSNGQLIRSTELFVGSGSTALELTTGKQLPAGQYTLQIAVDSSKPIETRSLILEQ
ncbi:MAG: type sorting protein [Ferruginibacter sp.]|uniref:T9SS type A sorting domain-containing protein n=1 Tax=Ferruginibacter sp. TaxID=1940288 RepID=UPI00265AD418|nr:T9SS type A sorting domain-containing protein [Ferruginibacter sp.]MDB5275620.1 type sorting protein [Ferruginibacter sp.]